MYNINIKQYIQNNTYDPITPDPNPAPTSQPQTNMNPNLLYANVGIPALVFAFAFPPVTCPRCALDCQACHFTRGWFGCGTYVSSVSFLSVDVESLGSTDEELDVDGAGEDEEDGNVLEGFIKSGPVALEE